MSANQPPPSPPQSPPPPAGGKGPLVAALAVIAVVGVVVAVSQSGKKPTTDAPAPVSTAPSVSSGVSGTTDRPQVGYAAMEAEPSRETPELFWLHVADPQAVHGVLRKNAWLGQAIKDPVGQGFIAAWGGFFGTRGEDIGDAFKGAVSELVLDQVLASPYRVVWYGGEGAKGAPAIVLASPGAAANGAFDTLVKVAASGGFNPPACVSSTGSTDGGASNESIHRIVLADKIIFAARLGDRLVLSPRPQAAMLAMCKELPAMAARPGVAVSLGFALGEGGRGPQSLGAMLGLGSTASLDFGVEGSAFVPRGLDAEATGGRLAALEPSPELLKAIPEKSGVVLFLAVTLPKELSAISLRDTLAPEGEDFDKTRKSWAMGAPRQIAVIWNPRGNRNTEVAVLWADATDEKALDAAMTKGSGGLQKAKACSLLAFASTRELLADVQTTCSGKTPSMLQAAQPVAKGLAQSASIALTVNLGRVLSQLTIDGWLSEHPAPNATTGPQEIEAARKLLEQLPTLGFRATVGADGKIVSGGFKS